MSRPSRNRASPNPVISFRLTSENVAKLDQLAERWTVTRAEAAERLVVDGLVSNGIEAHAVRAQAKAARRIGIAYLKRIREAIRAVLDEDPETED